MEKYKLVLPHKPLRLNLTLVPQISGCYLLIVTRALPCVVSLRYHTIVMLEPLPVFLSDYLIIQQHVHSILVYMCDDLCQKLDIQVVLCTIKWVKVFVNASAYDFLRCAQHIFS